MAEILVCSQPVKNETLRSQFDLGIEDVWKPGLSTVSTLSPYQPYLVGQRPDNIDRAVLASLGSPFSYRNLTELTFMYGQANLTALAEIHQKLHKAEIHKNIETVSSAGEFGKTVIDQSSHIIEKRKDSFVKAAENYKKDLLKYRDAIKAKDVKGKMVAELKAKASFDKLQRNFRVEFRTIKDQIASRKGNPLNNLRRGKNIARSSRNIEKLEFDDTIEATRLGRFARYSKVLGHGLAVVDFGMGVNEIRNTYQQGGNWEKDMFKVSSKFVTDAAIGELATDAAAILLLATPAGWVGLLVGGVIAVGAAVGGAYSASKANEYINKNSGSIYDRIMDWFEGK